MLEHVLADGHRKNPGLIHKLFVPVIGMLALADRLGMAVSVCHYPPGTSKWNQVEHRLFSFISMNWRGRPLLSYEVVVNLIGGTTKGTTTKSGLRVKALLDTREYEPGQNITDDEMRPLRLNPP